MSDAHIIRRNQGHAWRIAAEDYLKLLKARAKGERVDAEEYAASRSAVFGVPPPVVEDLDHETAKTLFKAIVDIVRLHGRKVRGPGRVRRKVVTPAGLSISMSMMPTAADGAVEFMFVGRMNDAIAFALQVNRHADGRFTGQISWDGGSWFEPFLEHWRTTCPPDEQGGQP